jgi:hypothetical protein
MSDAENAPSDPAEAGKQRADPDDMSTDKPTQNDAETAQKPGQAINGFEGLYPRMTGQVWATVLSTRNDTVTAYRCKLDELECYAADGSDCPDLSYNHDGSGVCDHIAAAIYQAPKTPDMDAVAMDGALSVLETAQDAADAAHNTAKTLQRARADHALETAENATQADAEPSDEELADAEPVDPAEAAKRLQQEFDEAAEGMEVTDADGKVWVNKTPDAPDWTFEAFLSGPDLMQYDPDGGPGEYYSNYIEPSDVDTYISEVLE